ncbi:MAG: hypothetical protein Q7S45_02125 [Candidatus Curtissbacteria bacterium]|nr:hypothetical protein [Candidatus Curtissbacteria bacterium]
MGESKELVPPEKAPSHLSDTLDRLGIEEPGDRILAVYETLISEILTPKKDSQGFTNDQALAALSQFDPDLAGPLLKIGDILRERATQTPETETAESAHRFLKNRSRKAG